VDIKPVRIKDHKEPENTNQSTLVFLLYRDKTIFEVIFKLHTYIRNKMKTLDIEIAIMQHIGIRQNLIVPNVSWGISSKTLNLHECDVLSLSKSGYATEYEIKVSKYDLLKDKEKWHGHYHEYIAYLFFAVPEKLKDIALTNIPVRAGLFIAKKDPSGLIYVTQIKTCLRNKKAVKWTDEDRCKLARLGTMRILKLKEKIQKLRNQQLL